MAALYQQLYDPMTGGISQMILRVADQAHIPPDPANRDRYEYEEWLAQGNQPDPPPAQPAPQPAEAPVTRADLDALAARIEQIANALNIPPAREA